MADIKGKIFKIKRFSIHDGPGIRTSVFLKGCPLSCAWCHSPEGIDTEILPWYNRNSCIKCGRCKDACPEKALEMTPDPYFKIEIDRVKCNLTGNCVSVCPSEALQFTGWITTTREVFDEIIRDVDFYNYSGGGVTLTGGEPLFQPDFAAGILELCKMANIHTSIETSLYAESETVRRLSSLTDLVIADLKLFDTEKHIFYSAQSNEKIKENFLLLAESKQPLIVRVPLVENITDTPENKNSIFEFVRSAGRNILVEFIPYNPLASNSYRRLGINFPLEQINFLKA